MIRWSYDIIVFLLGISVGSFLNVVIMRVPENRSVLFPGSACLSCGRSLKWWMNIPLLSYLLLKGKCAYCKAPLSPQYPLVELVTGLVGLFVVHVYGFNWVGLFVFVNFSVLIVIFVIDLRTRLILNKVLGSWFVMDLPFLFYGIHSLRWNWVTGIIGAVIGFLFYLFIAWLGQKMFGKESLGMGDVKYAAIAGWLLGADLILPMVVFSSLLALVVILPVYIREMGKRAVYVPYGPFLSVGTMIFLVIGDQVRQWLTGSL